MLNVQRALPGILATVIGCTGSIGGAGPSSSAGPTIDGRPREPEPITTPGAPIPEGGTVEMVTCDRDARPSNPSRLWRLNPEQLSATYARVFGTELALRGHPFEAIGEGDSGSTFTNLVEVSTMHEEAVRRLTAAVQDVVGPAADRALLDEACLADAPSEGCLRRHLEPLVARATRKADNGRQVDRLVQRAMAENDEGGDGLLLAYALLALSPEVLFRWELANDGASLSSEAYAEFLAFTLTDEPPSAELAERLGAGADPREEARALLGSDAGRDVLHRFMREYFDYDASDGDSKDDAVHSMEALIESTRVWVDALIDGPNFFQRLLLSTEVYANRDSAYAYGVMASGDEHERFDLGPDQRSGILTQPSFLANLATFDHTDPTKRGHFILNHFLCDEVGGIPADVPPLPDDPTLTMRERLDLHRSRADCAACHSRMDPLGFPLEQFDHLGRWRDEEKGRPVDTSGEFFGGTDIDGRFETPRDLAEALASSAQAGTCFVNHAFQFVYGRMPAQSSAGDVIGADACVIADVYEAWSTSEGSLVDLFVELMVSEAARTRIPASGEER
ncbi:MAG: DUF1588 domain-containing protein [Myxococcota bacterium]